MMEDIDLQKHQIITALLQGKKFYRHEMEDAHYSLVFDGYANYYHLAMYKNWKTDWWSLPVVPWIPPEPISSRFEILDL